MAGIKPDGFYAFFYLEEKPAPYFGRKSSVAELAEWPEWGADNFNERDNPDRVLMSMVKHFRQLLAKTGDSCRRTGDLNKNA